MAPEHDAAGPQVQVDGDDNTVYAPDGNLFVGGSHRHYDAQEDFVRLHFRTLRLSGAPRDAVLISNFR